MTDSLSQQIWTEVDRAITTTLDEIGIRGEAHAKRLAPVRKVFFTGRNARPRILNRAQIANLPRSVQVAMIPNTARFGPGAAVPGGEARTTVRRSGASFFNPVVRVAKGQRGVRFSSDIRSLQYIGHGKTSRETGRPEARYGLVLHTLLTSRGRYELAHAEERRAAFHEPGGRTTLGGTLRGEIGWAWILEGPERYEIQIQSPGPGTARRSAAYARFVELPTSRTAEQPYLRPTLQYLKRPLVTLLKRNLERAGMRPA